MRIGEGLLGFVMICTNGSKHLIERGIRLICPLAKPGGRSVSEANTEGGSSGMGWKRVSQNLVGGKI